MATRPSNSVFDELLWAAPDHLSRNEFRSSGILVVSHHVPLYSSPPGRRYGRAASATAVTDRISETLLRLPLCYQMAHAELERVCDGLRLHFSSAR